MYDKTITLFNYHEDTALWYPSIIENAEVFKTTASSNTTTGTANADVVEILINCNSDKSIKTKAGVKGYLSPKAYQKCDAPEEYITFSPDKDFIYCDEWPDTEPVSDDECFDSGFYQKVNTEYDEVYKINSAASYGLIPHFEIGGS